MTKQIIIKNKEELQCYRERIEDTLKSSVQTLQAMIENHEPLEIFHKLKYEKTVPEPLSGQMENFIEVINQSQTYLVSIRAAEYLINTHPEHEFVINWGNITGHDIESTDGSIIAEGFAATSYKSNEKLRKDLTRLCDNKTAIKKYEFFYDKEFKEKQKAYYENKYDGIEIIKFWEL